MEGLRKKKNRFLQPGTEPQSVDVTAPNLVAIHATVSRLPPTKLYAI